MDDHIIASSKAITTKTKPNGEQIKYEKNGYTIRTPKPYVTKIITTNDEIQTNCDKIRISIDHFKKETIIKTTTHKSKKK